jgi:hypothetical protein
MGGIQFNGTTNIHNSVIAGTATVHMGPGGPTLVGSPPPASAAAPQPAATLTGAAWDLFLCHASPDKAAWARPLYDALAASKPSPAAFLDEASVPNGVDWDTTITDALRAAPVIAVLVSDHAEAAYYLRDEVRAAVEAARADPTLRVIPVALGRWPARLPFGLGLKKGIVATTPAEAAARLHEDVLAVARPRQLLRLLQRLAPDPADLAKITAEWPEFDPMAPPPDHHAAAARATMTPARFDAWATAWPAHLAAINFVAKLWT